MTLASDDKVLILFRHAKAEQVAGKPDQDRALNRGASAKPGPPVPGCTSTSWAGAGAVLDRHPDPPDLGRGRRGWRLRRDLEFDDSIYSGGAQTVLQTVRETAGEAQVVLVVGHNPTMAVLASGLSEGDGRRRPTTAWLPVPDLVARGAALRRTVVRARLRHGRARAVPRLARGMTSAAYPRPALVWLGP